MELFHGNKHAFELDQHISHHLSLIDHKALGELAIVQIGANASSQKYIALKLALCAKLGINAKSYDFSSSLPNDALLSKVSKICTSTSIKSVIIQLPLPNDITKDVLNLIPLEKDVDTLSDLSQRNFYSGNFSLLSPVVRAVNYFLDYYKMSIQGLKVDIIGKGFLVGAPLTYYLAHKGALVQTYDENDDISKIVFKADLVISATGKPNIITGNNLYKGTSVIDFGSSIVAGKLVGDINMDTDLDHLRFLSPSPGGLGPLVVRFLLINHLGF